MSPHTLQFPRSEEKTLAASGAWPRLAPLLSERRWEVTEEPGRNGVSFHGFASRNHPRRRSFQPGPGGLLHLALSGGPVQLIVGSSDAVGVESFLDELRAYTRMFARTPGEISALVDPWRSGWRLDPGRTLGLQQSTACWTSLCIRFASPPLGLLLATHAFLWLRDGNHTTFARLHADHDDPHCMLCERIAAHETVAQIASGVVSAESLQDGYAGVFLQAG